MRRAFKLLLAVPIVVVALLFLGMCYGLADIAAGLIDNQLGIVTGHAIRTVAAHPEGKVTVGAAVRASSPNATWSAVHDDDDSLLSVRVSADGAQWCVSYMPRMHPLPRLVVDEIVPANRAAQEIAPSMGANFHPLPRGGWSCGAIRHYFPKHMPIRPAA